MQSTYLILLVAVCAAQIALSATVGMQMKPGIEIVGPQEYADLQVKAKYADVAYCVNYDTFLPYTCQLCNDKSIPLEDRQSIFSPDRKIEGFVGVNYNTATIYFGFQGSQYVENFITALNLLRVPLDFNTTPEARERLKRSGSTVHEGFLNAYNLVRNDLIIKLSQAIRKNPTFEVHGLGHSAGGVLSTLAAADLAVSNVVPPSKLSITTFGSPRFGNYEFAKFISKDLGFKSVIRVVHSSDIVVHVYGLRFGFRHAGVEIWLDVATKKAYRCDDVPDANSGGYDESPSCSNGLRSAEYTVKAHQSYFDFRDADVCLPSTSSAALQYLPFEIKP
ncbi:hypothetical protein HDV05_004032 [Chytridiales sp. JEL 0842]|nr:hypothetical protein HDV05_004032 [Chytridiales sp. JEL 0842]